MFQRKKKRFCLSIHCLFGCINVLNVKSMAFARNWVDDVSNCIMGHYLECNSFIHWSFEGCAGNRGAKFDTQNSPIRHLHISHNAPYLPPTILHNLCCSFLLGITAVPRAMKTMLMQNFGGQIRCIMGDVQVGNS